MKDILVGISAFVIIIIYVVVYSLCKVSGEMSRAEEEEFRRNNE